MATLIDTYNESNSSGSVISLRNGTYIYAAQSFTNDNVIILSHAKFYIKKVGSPTGNVTAYIYEHDGTYGTGSSPGLTPLVLATSDTLDIETEVTTSFQVLELAFSGAEKITLTSSTYYIVALKYSGGDSGNRLVAAIDTTSSTHDGNKSKSTTGATWTVDATEDLIFYVYGDDTLPIKINIGDTFKDVESIKINIGDSWKDVDSVNINISDVWKTVF